jgi:hypothetical protein
VIAGYRLVLALLGIAVFLYLAATYRRDRSATVELVRGAAVLYLAVTGIVYDLLLSKDPAAAAVTLTWVNAVVHQIMPIAAIVDWLVDPPRHPIEMRGAIWWMAFPIVWLAYSMIRGAVVDWYPYPFMDPRKHGAVEIAVTLVVIGIGFFGVGGVVHWVGRRLGASGWPPPRAAEPVPGGD